MAKQFLIPPILMTERLVLRKIILDDIDALIKHANNPKISDRILNMPYPFREPDAIFKLGTITKGFKEGNRFTFAIILKSINELIGEITLNLEGNNQGQLGYWLSEVFWNLGYTSEAIEPVITFGLEKLNLDLIYASTKSDNTGSIKVLEKNNFILYNQKGSILTYYIKKDKSLLND